MKIDRIRIDTLCRTDQICNYVSFLVATKHLNRNDCSVVNNIVLKEFSEDHIYFNVEYKYILDGNTYSIDYEFPIDIVKRKKWFLFGPEVCYCDVYKGDI